MIISAFFGIIAYLTYAESYPPVLLQRRAAKRRFETRNWALHAQAVEQQVEVHQIIHTYLYRPFLMNFLEPMLILITLYMCFIFGMLYLFFESYPIAFQELRGWKLGIGALPFISILTSVVINVLIIIYNLNTRFKRKMEENGGRPVPEGRLYVSVKAFCNATVANRL